MVEPIEGRREVAPSEGELMVMALGQAAMALQAAGAALGAIVSLLARESPVPVANEAPAAAVPDESIPGINFAGGGR